MHHTIKHMLLLALTICVAVGCTFFEQQVTSPDSLAAADSQMVSIADTVMRADSVAAVADSAHADSVMADSAAIAQKADSLKGGGPEKKGIFERVTGVKLSGSSEPNDEAGAQWAFITPRKIFVAILVLLLSIVVIRYMTRLLEALSERWTHQRLLIKGIIPVFRVLSYTLVVYFIIAYIFEPPVSALVAISASAGVAVGFASQDILKNIFGGIMLLTDRPFQVGDKIQVGDHYGEVVQIGLRTVRIVTPDDSVVSIPNGEMMNQSVSNANSGASDCQVVAEFYLPADVDLVKAKRLAQRAAAVSRYFYSMKPIAIVVKNENLHGRSLLKMRLKAYVIDIRYEFPFMSEMTELVMTSFLKEGVVTAEELSFMPPVEQGSPRQ